MENSILISSYIYKTDSPIKTIRIKHSVVMNTILCIQHAVLLIYGRFQQDQS